MTYGPKTYQLITISNKLTKGGLEEPAIGQPFGDLMTRQEAESMASQGKGSLTYYNTITA